jgi:CheY-like chemotaxis protein
VFDNLLINAVKFTPPRGHVNVSFKREGQSFRVTVSDTGIGIARESLPRVFELYRGAETSSRRGTAGLGLGLGIAKHLVELHGGRIGVTSAGPGQGATFTVTLPEQTETRETEVLVKEEVVDRAPTLGGIAVLVVDDEVDAREPLRRLLTQVGAEVVAVASAEEALEHLAQRKFQAIVSDIAMSGRNGYDLVRSIRRVVGNAIPVIALSAYASAKDQELSLREGFDAHLSKPVDAPTLITTVEGMVRRSRPQREQ